MYDRSLPLMQHNIFRYLKTALKSYIYAARHCKSQYAEIGLGITDIARFYRRSELGSRAGTVTTTLFGVPILAFNDYFWYLHSVDELFVDEVYRCSLKSTNPVIIDCGANIGLSLIYFKRLFPSAELTAFEPDKIIFSNLQSNLKTFGFTNVNIVNKAVWSASTTLSFRSTGDLGGAVSLQSRSTALDMYEVETVRLRDYLSTRVDFLKIDIEGAEFDVLADCRDLLGNVENLFLEYHGFGNSSQKLHEMLGWIQEAGFRYHIKEAWRNQTHPFVQKQTVGLDQQLNIFCYRV